MASEGPDIRGVPSIDLWGIVRDRIRQGLRPALFSAIVPGLGQIHKGEVWRGMTLVVMAALTLVFSILSYDILKADASYPITGGLGLVALAFLPYIAVWTYGFLDALLSR